MNNRNIFWDLCLLLGIFLIFAGELFYWTDSITSFGYRPINLPLFSSANSPAPLFHPFSYGTAVLFLLFISYIAARVRRPLTVAWCAFFMFLLGLLCPLQICFSQPSWLDLYWQNHLEYTSITGFAIQYSYPITCPALISGTILGIDGLYDRIVATADGIKIGWSFHVIGSFLLLVGAISFVGRWNILRPHATCAAFILLATLAMNLAGPVAGEICWNHGLAAERAGELDQASRYYHWAIDLDGWNRYNGRVYQRLGAVAEAQSRWETPEYHLLQGMRQAEWGSMEADSALDEFNQAMTSSDPFLARQARYQYGTLAANYALAIYRSSAPGMAAVYWQKAAPMKEENHVAEDYLSARAFQDSGQYNKALDSLAQAQTEANALLLQGQFDCSLGDVYYFRKDVANARLQYLNSYSLLENYIEYKDIRAQKALTDNLQL
ncbi:MAG TPA: hypothetical protein VL981_09775 [Candidatus Methylacidiphilales bacterium]|nr:hypothetical protein [Candidatus Methylacidiphilales bacterium]